MKKKLKLNQLNESELTKKALKELKGGQMEAMRGCVRDCWSQPRLKRVWKKVHPS